MVLGPISQILKLDCSRYSPDDDRIAVFIFYSSGTTSLPKAVELAHLNAGAGFNQSWGMVTSRQTCLTILLVFHVARSVVGVDQLVRSVC
jgi:long-subunit acyl-CoA synthetase (AMP-forming)